MNRRLIAPLLVGASACIISRGVQVSAIERPSGPADTVMVRSPVKVHLLDGSTVLFRDGAEVSRDNVWGVGGMRYSLTLRDSSGVSSVPLDSVVGMEAFRSQVNGGRTFVYSVLATAGVIGASIAIYCATDPKCFGSCPTFYADSGGSHVLEAEGFSYSIAPLFEARDVDRLRIPGDRDGVFRLEVRNEAFETHYINHLELLEVRHAPNELAVPDELNRPFVVGSVAPPLIAKSRSGGDTSVRRQLEAADGDAYRTPDSILGRAHADDFQDWIDIVALA